MRKILLLTVFVFCCLLIEQANAQGILGKSYLGFYAGSITPGDETLNEIDSSVLSYGFSGRYPITKNVDGTVSIGFQKLDGPAVINYFDGYNYYQIPIKLKGDSTILGGGCTFHFLPDQTVDPFILIGFYQLSNKLTMTDASGYSETENESNMGFSGGAGAEFGINEYFAITPNFSFFTIDGESETAFEIAGIFWFENVVGLMVSTSYAFDAGDFGIQGGIGFKF